MDPLVLAAGSALVSAMATDAWAQARTAVVTWWQRSASGRTVPEEAELEAAHEVLLAAREGGDAQAERALVEVWCERLQQLLADEPQLRAGLERLLAGQLRTGPAPHEPAEAASMTVRAEARDNARVYVAGRDQHITGS